MEDVDVVDVEEIREQEEMSRVVGTRRCRFDVGQVDIVGRWSSDRSRERLS